MVKRNTKRIRRRAPKTTDVLTMRCSGFYQYPLTVGANTVITLNIEPTNFGQRLTSLSTVYELFKFIKLKIKLPYVLATGQGLGLGYYKTLPTTAPTTVSALSEAEKFVWRATGTTDSGLYLNITQPNLCINTQPWYECDANSGTDLAQLIQGALFFINSTSATFTSGLEIEYICMFSGKTIPAVDLPLTNIIERKRLFIEEIKRSEEQKWLKLVSHVNEILELRKCK
jgi:hypothetical protein